MKLSPTSDLLTPIYDGFREDYFLAWLEDYGIFCIPNFVATVQEGRLVLRLLAHKFEHRTRFADYAILYRSNHLSRVFEEQLRTHKVPYTAYELPPEKLGAQETARLLGVSEEQVFKTIVVVREGKGAKDRVKMLPQIAIQGLRQQIAIAREQHKRDLAEGSGEVGLPNKS